MNKTTLILLGILAFWIVVFIAIFEFHIGIPMRAIFFMAFVCVVWLAYWTVNAIRDAIQSDVQTIVTKAENKSKQTEQTKKEDVSEYNDYI